MNLMILAVLACPGNLPIDTCQSEDWQVYEQKVWANPTDADMTNCTSRAAFIITGGGNAKCEIVSDIKPDKVSFDYKPTLQTLRF